MMYSSIQKIKLQNQMNINQFIYYMHYLKEIMDSKQDKMKHINIQNNLFGNILIVMKIQKNQEYLEII